MQRTTVYAKSLGEGGIDLEQAHLVRLFLPSFAPHLPLPDLFLYLRAVPVLLVDASPLGALVEHDEERRDVPRARARPSHFGASFSSSRHSACRADAETFALTLSLLQTVPEELDSARSSVHGPHPGVRLQVEPVRPPPRLACLPVRS